MQMEGGAVRTPSSAHKLEPFVVGESAFRKSGSGFAA